MKFLKWLWLVLRWKRCRYCKEFREDVRERGSMTAYYWDGKGKNPNAPVVSCDPCYTDYSDYWKDMWNEYWSSVRG